jgi:hypothetical protein
MGLLKSPLATRLLGALRPGPRAETLSPGVEALLRGLPRVEAPDGLRYRILAAHERGVRPSRLPRAVSPAWVGGLAAAALLAALVPAAMTTAPRDPSATFASAPLRIRVVEDPSLGMGSPTAGPRFSLPAFDEDAIDGP